MKTVDLPVSLCLPMPPSVNGYWPIRVRNNRPLKALSKEAKAYKSHVATLLLPLTSGRVPTAQRLGAHVVVHPRDKRAQDLDNRLKGLFDSLERLLYRDDSQIDEMSVVRGLPFCEGAVVLTLWAKDDPPEHLPSFVDPKNPWGVLPNVLVGEVSG